MEGIRPFGGLPPIQGGALELTQPLALEANKVNALKPVPEGGVPNGHPASRPVQEAHQVSLGGQPNVAAENAIAGIGRFLKS